MDGLFELIASIVQSWIPNIKNTESRRWAETIWWSALGVIPMFLCSLLIVCGCKENDLTAIAIFTVITVLVLCAITHFVVRGHKRYWAEAETENPFSCLVRKCIIAISQRMKASKEKKKPSP